MSHFSVAAPSCCQNEVDPAVQTALLKCERPFFFSWWEILLLAALNKSRVFVREGLCCGLKGFGRPYATRADGFILFFSPKNSHNVSRFKGQEYCLHPKLQSTKNLVKWFRIWKDKHR
uniref:Uncharacterized protein n=1 Tax=Oryzias melastigma TaxID=30732 RepID=A0A3B3CPX7_ORYME